MATVHPLASLTLDMDKATYGSTIKDNIFAEEDFINCQKIEWSKSRRATQDCEKALEQDPTYLKAITRAAQAQLKLGKVN